MMRVVLFGPPGVGKGTTAKLLSKHYNLPHISTGDVFRAEIAKESELGKTAKEYVDSGMLVPDDVVTQMVKGVLLQAKDGFFLDGYPRTVEQAKALKAFSDIDHVLNLSAPKKVIVERIANRNRESGGMRADDSPDKVSRRLEEYEEKTLPVIDFYRNEGMLIDIDSTQDVQGVLKQCIGSLGVKNG